VKKFALALAAALAVGIAPQAVAQEAAKAAPAKDTTPHRVGLVDMAKVFEGYSKFKAMREELAAEISKSDAEAKAMVEKMQAKQKEIAESGLTAGSPEYERAEKELLDAKGEFEAFRAATQRKLARRESEMFKVIYADTTSMVKKYAEYAGYTVVMRFDSKDIEDDTPPAEAVQRMNKQVVYYRPQDDITETVLNALNRNYDNAPTAAAKTPVRQTSGAAPRSAQQ